MILIRGIRGEKYARKIEEGKIDCRDLLSAILKPPNTGYEYSDYFERNLVKALKYLNVHSFKKENDPLFLFSMLTDYYIPHIYLTYFHILNERTIEWLEKFEDDYCFIAVDANVDQLTKTVIGDSFFGARMTYVDDINELDQNRVYNYNAAIMCSLEYLFSNKKDMLEPINVYSTLSFPLLCRERDAKFSDIENEFRIISYDCPKISKGKISQISRQVSIFGKTGARYSGTLFPKCNSVFANQLLFLNDPYLYLLDLLIKEDGNITIDSDFKSIDIKQISDEYIYLGGKEECANYVKTMIKKKPTEKYINRTILKERYFSDGEFKIYNSHWNVEY